MQRLDQLIERQDEDEDGVQEIKEEVFSTNISSIFIHQSFQNNFFFHFLQRHSTKLRQKNALKTIVFAV